MNTVSGSISCVFLVITFLVYVLVPELSTLHGKIVLSNVFSMLLLTIFILLAYFITHLLPYKICQIVGYGGYFLTMSMFWWMTIMSFDLCWTFMRAKAPCKNSAMHKFFIYSAVAWGLSAAMTLVIILADHMMGEQIMFLPKPNVGLTKCFLEDDSQRMYLHLPIMFLIIFNGIFFTVTTVSIYRFSYIRQELAVDNNLHKIQPDNSEGERLKAEKPSL